MMNLAILDTLGLQIIANARTHHRLLQLQPPTMTMDDDDAHNNEE
jgi:hypothetical protein